MTRDINAAVTEINHGLSRADRAVKFEKIHRRRANKVSDKEGRRLVVYVRRRAKLFNHGIIHNHNLVAHLHRLKLIMGNIDRRCVHSIMQRSQFFRHTLTELRVQRAQWFIHHKRLGLANNGAPQGNPLPVAAGKAANRFVQDMLNTQHAGNFRHFCPRITPPHALTKQRVTDILPDIHMRIKREHLEHERDIAFRWRAPADLLAVEVDFPGRGQF